MKERKQQTLYISRKDTVQSSNRRYKLMNSLPAGACLEHFQWGGHAGALPPNGVATSDQKKKS